MKSVLVGVSTLLAVLSISEPTSAAILTSDFRDFENPFLLTYYVGRVPLHNLTTLGPVKITNSNANMFFWGGAYITGTPSDPAQPGGWGATSSRLPLVLNLDTPVKAFGITFDNAGNMAGSILAAYDGANGTGQLIGQIESVWVPPPSSATNQPIDFVGVIDEQTRIRSVLLIAHGTDAIQIRAMALTIPEPTTSPMMLSTLIIYLVTAGRKRSYGAGRRFLSSDFSRACCTVG